MIGREMISLVWQMQHCNNSACALIQADCKYSVDTLQQDQEEFFLNTTKSALEITKCHFTQLHFTELVTLELHHVESRVEHVQNILDNINIPEKWEKWLVVIVMNQAICKH